MKLFNFLKKKKATPLIIMIHGFGKRRNVEFANLIKALEHDYDIIAPNLFDQRYVSDNVWYNWVSRAEEAIIQAKNEGREIILIGFSMGGVIASYLASKFVIKRLILLAPAFDYATITTASNIVTSAINKEKKEEEFVKLPSEFYKTFMDVVDNCKEAIFKVQCPTLFIAALKDELIPYTVAHKYYRKMENPHKRLVLLGDGQHRLLDDPATKDVAIELIKSFIAEQF